LFRHLNEEQGITIILVTHDRDIATHAKRTVTLRDGLIVADEFQTDSLAELTQPEGTEPQES
jgi:ABC-type lipoprotein export system ATPase subunit